MNKQRVSVLLAAGAGIVGTLMPWVTVSMLGISQSENGLGTGDGKIIIVLFGIACLVSLLGDWRFGVEGGARIGAIVLGLAGAIIAIMDINNFHTKIGGGGGGMISIGFGLYLIVIAGFLLPILAFAVPSYVGGDSGKAEA